MNIAYHELMNDSRLMIDPNRDVNEVCAMVLAGTQNGCVILGGGSPKNFYLQAQPTLWEVYGIPKGGNDYFIQITTDQVVWGGLSGATPAEAVSWGKVNPGVLPDTVVAYCDSTIAFPLFCEYALGVGQRPAPAEGTAAPARQAGRGTRRRSEGGQGEPRSEDEARGGGEQTSEWEHCHPNWRRMPNGSRRGRASTPTRTCRPAWSRTCGRRSNGMCSSSWKKPTCDAHPTWSTIASRSSCAAR